MQELLHSGPFQDFYILDHFRFFPLFLDHSGIFKFWTIQVSLYFGSLHNFYIMEHSQISILWTIPKQLRSGTFQRLNVLDHSKISMFWTVSYFLSFWTIPESLHSTRSQVWTIPELKKFWTIPEFLADPGEAEAALQTPLLLIKLDGVGPVDNRPSTD